MPPPLMFLREVRDSCAGKKMRLSHSWPWRGPGFYWDCSLFSGQRSAVSPLTPRLPQPFSYPREIFLYYSPHPRTTDHACIWPTNLSNSIPAWGGTEALPPAS